MCIEYRFNAPINVMPHYLTQGQHREIIGTLDFLVAPYGTGWGLPTTRPCAKFSSNGGRLC